MAAKPVIIDATCPGCKKDHAVAVPLDDLNIAMGRVQHDAHTEIPTAQLEGIVERALEKKLPKKEIEAPEVKKPKAEVVAPNFMPRFRCPDGNCEIGNHKNKNYKSKPAKKCTNCDQFAPKTAKKCLWCDKEDFDDLDDDDLEGLGIPLPSIAEHEHSHDQE